ncbi:MAG: Antilisterial bacteriocin subtilosin biosynthesis protein AlbA [Magnetococcales bacterium]|nr:Antilisterial bacteriocin subtilosin biosynthesis protein AlbA [Magnetococcales bacterium]
MATATAAGKVSGDRLNPQSMPLPDADLADKNPLAPSVSAAVTSSVIEAMRGDVERVFKNPEEQKKVYKMLADADAQSKARKIIHTKSEEPFKKFITLWKIRFKYGIHWGKRFYVMRLIRNVALGKFYNFFKIKKYILRGIEYAGTYRCNFRCHHCLCIRLDESDVRREMVPEDYARVTKEAMALGATTFGLEGGEPFVNQHWAEILEACQGKVNHLVISTNGWHFNEERAKRAAELGVDTVNFSLDSGYREMHDLFRLRYGSFDRVMEGIRLCRKYGIKVIINTVVHRENIYTEHYRALLDLAEREKLLINTLFAKGVGNLKGRDVLLDEQGIRDYHELIRPYNYVQRHLNYNYGKQFGCPGTKEMINMTPYGDVLNCANMHIYLGNVMEYPLKTIRDNALKKTPFGAYHSCFLADDRDFMNVYYSLLDRKPHFSIKEFNEDLYQYEQENEKVVYPELRAAVGDLKSETFEIKSA